MYAGTYLFLIDGHNLVTADASMYSAVLHKEDFLKSGDLQGKEDQGLRQSFQPATRHCFPGSGNVNRIMFWNQQGSWRFSL